MRRLVGAGAALAIAVALVVYTSAAYCYPLCSLWTDANPEYYLFFCYFC